MNIQTLLQQLASNPPTKAVVNILASYNNVIATKPPPQEFSSSIIQSLIPMYQGAPYSLALGYVIKILKVNNIGANLPEPNNAEAMIQLLSPPVAPPSSNPYGLNESPYTVDNTGGGEMDFNDEESGYSGNDYGIKPEEEYGWVDEDEPIVKPKVGVASNRPNPNKIYTLGELIGESFPLVKNCINIPGTNYKSLVNLAVGVKWDFNAEGDVQTETRLEPKQAIKVFSDEVLVDGIRIKSMTELWDSTGSMRGDNIAVAVSQIVDRSIKSREDYLHVRHVLYVNGIYNRLINLILNMCGSTTTIDNGIMDYPELRGIYANGEKESYVLIASRISEFTERFCSSSIKVKDGDSDKWQHKIPIISSHKSTIELCLLVASVPMYLDKVVHKSIIRDLKATMAGERHIVILRLLDTDFIVVEDINHNLIISSLDINIP